MLLMVIAFDYKRTCLLHFLLHFFFFLLKYAKFKKQNNLNEKRHPNPYENRSDANNRWIKYGQLHSRTNFSFSLSVYLLLMTACLHRLPLNECPTVNLLSRQFISVRSFFHSTLIKRGEHRSVYVT